MIFPEGVGPVADPEGWLTGPEADTLRRLAGAAEGPILEIGTWRGRSCLTLAGATEQLVFSVDPHDGSTGLASSWSSFLAVLADSDVKNVVPLRMTSDRAYHLLQTGRRWLGGLYIDGDHEEAAVLQDLRWTDQLLPGAFLALHDHGQYPGVARAVETLELKGELTNTIWWTRV